jgi:hypothetical protein
MYLKGNRQEKEWRGTESNRRRRDFQSLALPTELPRLSLMTCFRSSHSINSSLVKVNGENSLMEKSGASTPSILAKALPRSTMGFGCRGTCAVTDYTFLIKCPGNREAYNSEIEIG